MSFKFTPEMKEYMESVAVARPVGLMLEVATTFKDIGRLDYYNKLISITLEVEKEAVEASEAKTDAADGQTAKISRTKTDAVDGQTAQIIEAGNVKRRLIPIDFEFDDETQDIMEDLAINSPVAFLKALSNVFRYTSKEGEEENYNFVSDRLADMADDWRHEKNNTADGQDERRA